MATFARILAALSGSFPAPDGQASAGGAAKGAEGAGLEGSGLRCRIEVRIPIRKRCIVTMGT